MLTVKNKRGCGRGRPCQAKINRVCKKYLGKDSKRPLTGKRGRVEKKIRVLHDIETNQTSIGASNTEKKDESRVATDCVRECRRTEIFSKKVRKKTLAGSQTRENKTAGEKTRKLKRRGQHHARTRAGRTESWDARVGWVVKIYLQVR